MVEGAAFTYGTLLSERVLQVVLGRVPKRVEAILHGYARYPVQGQCYPAVAPLTTTTTTTTTKGGYVEGLLLLELTGEEVDILDAFEDPAYDRCVLPVVLKKDADAVVRARVWARGPQNVADLDVQHQWDFRTFVALHEDRFLQRCLEWARDYHSANKSQPSNHA